MRGDGVFTMRGNKIHVSGSINGKYYRRSTGKVVSVSTKQWMLKADPIEILTRIIEKENPTTALSAEMGLEAFGLKVLDLTKSRRKKASQDDVVGLFKNRILPYFRNFRMEDIKPIDLINFLEAQKLEVNNDRVRRIKNIFGLILAYAEDNEIIHKNPMNARTVSMIDLEYTPVKAEAYTTGEMALILSSAKGWLKIFMDLSFKLGFRSCETMALKWSDINLENGTLALQRTIVKGIVEEFPVETKDKKNHHRMLQLFPESIELLKAYYNVRPSDEWLFINKDSRYFREGKTIIDYHLKPLLTDIGVTYRGLHATRRSFASVMHYGGENMSALQKTMGHSDGSAITKKHYINPMVLTQKYNMEKAKKSEELFNMMLDCSDKDL